VGQVPREVVRSEFAQADVFALPTLAEGSALAHLEALACGLPVVTTANAGSRVRDGEDGFVVPLRDASALADRLEQLVRDRQLRESMSQAARTHAEELSWSHFGELLVGATRAAMLAACAAKN
jgi:glycosyltransferase involved in cell wall biosynthesis